MKKILCSLVLSCFLLPAINHAAKENTSEEYHKGKRYRDVLVHVSSDLKDKTSLAYLDKYKIRQRLEQRIRANFDGQKGSKAPMMTLTVTITEFRFRTGDFLGKGADSRDHLKAEVLVEGSLKQTRKFGVNASLAKGLTRGSRAKRIVDELSLQLVSSL